jgi:uncharacterized protein YciI
VVFVLNYFNLKPNHELDAVSKQHMAFMERHVAAGTLLAAGAKVPRTGGIMIAQGVDRAAIEALVADDPIVKLGLARVEIIEFKAVARATDLPLSAVEKVF